MYSMNFMIKTICIVFFIQTSWTLSTESPPKAEALTLDNLNRPTREKSDSSRSSRCLYCGYDRSRFLFNKDDYYKRYPYITGYQQPATGYQPQPPLRDDPRYPAYPARDQGGYLPRDDPRYPAYPPRDDQRYAPRDQGYQSRGGYEDRNWYYQPERYDDRYKYYDDRYSSANRYDDRYNNRYDDRYDNRQPQQQQQQPGVGGYYDRDRYDTRYPSAGTQNYRGNGYDNRDTLQYDQQRDGFYRGGNTYDRGYDSRTNYDRDRGYDRYNPQNTRGYDNKNFRPWDETYRGISGFDNSGRGYYFATRPQSIPPSAPAQQLRPKQPQQINHDTESPSSPSSSSSQSSQSSSSQSSSTPDKNGYAGAWGYSNNNSNNHINNNNRDRDRNRDSGVPSDEYHRENHREKDMQEGNTYGSRQRPLGNTSYLHDRDTNVTPVDDTKKVKPVDNKTDLTTNTDTNSNNPSGTTSKDDKNKV